MERRPDCWIRGNMEPEDYENDEVRRLTHECPHRRPTGWSYFGPTNECYHPGALGEYRRSEVIDDVVVSGVIDGYATFCPAVDLSLTSQGEPSRLYIEAEYTVISDTPMDGKNLLLTVKEDE